MSLRCSIRDCRLDRYHLVFMFFISFHFRKPLPSVKFEIKKELDFVCLEKLFKIHQDSFQLYYQVLKVLYKNLKTRQSFKEIALNPNWAGKVQ